MAIHLDSDHHPITHTNSLLQHLMASSEYRAQDLRQGSLAMLREMVFRLASFVTPTSILPAIVFNWYQGLTALAVTEIGLFVVLVVHCWLLLKKNIRVFSPLALLLISAVILISTISAGTPQFIYWCFAFPVAFYLLVSRRQSFVLNIGWWVVCSIIATVILPGVDAISYIISHASVCFFLEVLYSILNHQEEQLKQMAIRDPLTNAFNRREMLDVLDQALMCQARYHTATSIVMIDIDHFKAINDRLGHREGDQVLKNLVATLNRRLRRTDKLCRYGGEEFVMILPNTGKREAHRLAEAVRRQVRTTNISSRMQVTISCGIAEMRDGDTVASLMDRCDAALYRAKKNGRDRIEMETSEQVAGRFSPSTAAPACE